MPLACNQNYYAFHSMLRTTPDHHFKRVSGGGIVKIMLKLTFVFWTRCPCVSRRDQASGIKNPFRCCCVLGVCVKSVYQEPKQRSAGCSCDSLKCVELIYDDSVFPVLQVSSSTCGLLSFLLAWHGEGLLNNFHVFPEVRESEHAGGTENLSTSVGGHGIGERPNFEKWWFIPIVCRFIFIYQIGVVMGRGSHLTRLDDNVADIPIRHAWEWRTCDWRRKQSFGAVLHMFHDSLSSNCHIFWNRSVRILFFRLPIW